MSFFNKISRAHASSASTHSDHLPSTLASGISEHENNSQHTPSINRPGMSDEVSIQSHIGIPSKATAVKDITFWGGLALMICNTAGPGSFTLPLVAQNAGWIPTVIVFVLVGILSYLSSMFICETMTIIPGNEQFQENVEFSNLVTYFLGNKYKIVVQIICFLCMMTNIVASIAICSQVFDNLIIQFFHKTCGIQLGPSVALICVTEQLPSSSPFSGVMIMSAGSLAALVMILPLCLLNLEDNIWIQLFSCVIIVLIYIQWTVTFSQQELVTSRVPAIGHDMSTVFGSVMFNYGFVTAVPSLANARKPGVSIQKVVGTSTSFMTTMFMVIAILGGMAYNIPENSSIIQAINSAPHATTLSRVTGFAYPIAALITSIPINMIVLRYNLIQSGACNKTWSTLLSGILPWFLAIPGMTGGALIVAVNWSSLLFVSSAIFLIPFILFIIAKKSMSAGVESMDVKTEKFESSNNNGSRKVCGLERLRFWKKATPSSDNNSNSNGSDSSLDIRSSMNEREVEDTSTEKRENSNMTEVTLCSSEKVPGHVTRTHVRTHSSISHVGSVPPPFLSGNNYAIPGLGACQGRPELFRRSSSELAIYRTGTDDSLPVTDSNTPDLENAYSSTQGNPRAIPTMKAIPRWLPISSTGTAWTCLVIMAIGIIATIIVSIIQEA